MSKTSRRPFLHRFFPVLPIKGTLSDFFKGPGIHTVTHHTDSFWVGAWLVETLHSASLTEVVFSLMCVKGIFRQIFLPMLKFKFVVFHKNGFYLFLGANAAIATANTDFSWGPKLKAHRTAVTSTRVFDLRHFFSHTDFFNDTSNLACCRPTPGLQL